MKNKKGITLISLVVTIVVLIILAGVAINMTIGQDGILTKAKMAKQNYQNATEKERNELAKMDTTINDYVTNSREGLASMEYSLEEKKVGKWIDDKPIYMKTIVGEGVSNGKILYVLNDGDYLVDVVGFIQVPGSYVKIGNYYGSTVYTGIFFRRNSDKAIGINCSQNYDSAYVLTLYYTKTTDKGNGFTLKINNNY